MSEEALNDVQHPSDCSPSSNMCLKLRGHQSQPTDLEINVKFKAALGSRGMTGEQSWAGSPIAVIPATGNCAIPECWRQFQDFHLFCITIIRASGSPFTPGTAAKASRWKRLRSVGQDKVWREHSQVVVKRFLHYLPRIRCLFIHTQSINTITICETQLLSHHSILTPLFVLSSNLLIHHKMGCLSTATGTSHRS